MSDSKAQAGSEPVPRASRIQLSFEFDMQKSAEESNRSFQYFLPAAYPPCTTPLSDLRPIASQDLRLESHHRGSVLFLRTIEEPIRVGSIQTLVIDSAGTADRLAVYNIDASVRADDYLPEDAVIAIKEPFFTAVETGSATLRVDHPTDVVRLDPGDDRVPKELVEELKLGEVRKTPLEWKSDGNKAYLGGNYYSAVFGYDGGVRACEERKGEEDEFVKRDILRNRAIVGLLSGRLERAMEDGEGAVIPESLKTGDDVKALNVKAYDRAGLAAYDLGDLEGARGLFDKVKTLAPETKDLESKFERIEARFKERNGEYDFPKMSKSSSKKHNRLDHADFISNTALRKAGSRGRGLFAVKDIPAGGLIVCEKALSVAFESDPIPRSCTILDPKTKRAATGTQANLLYNLTHKLSHNASLAKKFHTLFDGKSHSSATTSRIDGSIPVDTFRVLGIIDHNAFGCPTVRSSSKSTSKEAARQAGFYSTGLWVHIAYINHACDGNAMRSFIGDMMIIRATRDIKEGEEILHPYRIPDAVHTITQQELKKTFGFTCDCAVCAAEEATPALQQRKRAELIEKSRSFISSNSLSTGQRPNTSKLSQIEKIVQELEKTYNEESFKKLPRLGLVQPQLWLCQAYKLAQSREKVIKSALAVLRNMGFFVSTSGDKLNVERSHCQLDGTAIDAAMYASLAQKSQGKTKEAAQLEGLAKELYMVMNGELRGFEERYQES